ncbi:MAG: tyrosine-protein phosphatase, partial [Acetobacteraceae bacterium]
MFRGDLSTSRGRAVAWVDALLIDHAIFRLVWSNAAPVVPGVLYRCNHPTPGRLAALTRRWGLRGLITLRGPTGNGSDALAREAAGQLGLTIIDMPIDSRGAPRPERILRLADIYRTMPTPALIHCKSGADRAGFAAALFLLLQGASAAEALAQLSWRFGHVRRSRTGILDAFFLRYAREAEGRMPFLDWVREEYDPEALKRDFRAGGV